MTSNIDKPYFPSLFNWKVEDDKGLVVKDVSTGAVYGHCTRDSVLGIRVKCLSVFIGQGLVKLIMCLSIRIHSLCSKDYAIAGKILGEREWHIERQKWSKGLIPNLPNEKRRLELIDKHTNNQLIKNIVKIVTLPLAIVGLQLAALYGLLLNPWDGRKMIANVEATWCRDINTLTSDDFKNDLVMRCGEILAICMQPEDVWNDYNLYPFVGNHPKGTIRSEIREISVLARKEKEFFEGEGINISEVLTQIKLLKETVKGISPKDDCEFTEVNGHINFGIRLEKLSAVAKALCELKKLMFNLMQEREKVIPFQMAHPGIYFSGLLSDVYTSYNDAWDKVSATWQAALHFQHRSKKEPSLDMQKFRSAWSEKVKINEPAPNQDFEALRKALMG